MAGISLPKISVQLQAAGVVDAFADRRDLLVGQMTNGNGATAISGAPYRDVQAKSRAEIEDLFGTNSELTNRIFRHRLGNDGVSALDVIPIADQPATWVQASTTITAIGTPASADATITISLVDEYSWTTTVDIDQYDSDVDVINKLYDAINALPDECPVTATDKDIVATNPFVTLTASNYGVICNGPIYGIKVTGTIPGIGLTVEAFDGGTGMPDVTNIFDAVANRRYNGIGWPEGWYTSLNVIESFLEDRFNVDGEILRGFGFFGKTDTYANNKAYADASNSRVLYALGNNFIDFAEVDISHQGPVILIPADYVVSYFMGVRSKRLTPGALIADDVVTTASQNDAIGGPHMASLPYFNTPLRDISPGRALLQYTPAEQDELADAGFTVFAPNAPGTEIIMGRVVCPYKTDSAGNSNITFHKLNYSDTGDVCSEILQRASKARFVQTRLTTGDIVPGYSMENAATIKAHFMTIYRILADNVLVVKGSDAEKYVSDNLSVTLDTPNGTATVSGPIPIIVGLEQINYTLQYSFSLTEGQQITF